MYGTDRKGSIATTQAEKEGEVRGILERHDQFFRYLATDEELPWDYYTVRGLALPPEVLDKVFYDNALIWAPSIEKGF